MMTSRSERIDQEAAEWLIWLAEPDSDQPRLKTEFFRWLMLSPEHIKAFVDTAGVFQKLGLLDRSRAIDVPELIGQSSSNVIQLVLRGHFGT